MAGRDRLVDELGLPGTERLLTLSDGVVAIALTLLVLQLAVPVLQTGSAGTRPYVLWDRLYDEKDRFIAYAVSFYVIATFWLVHHRTYRLIRGHSESLAWWNFAYLFTITLIPFSSGLLGSDSQNPVSLVVFAANLLACSLSTSLVFLSAQRQGLLVDVVSPVTVRVYRLRALFIMAVLGTSIAVAFVAPGVAPFVWFGMIGARVVEPWVVRRARPEDLLPLPGPAPARIEAPGRGGTVGG
jgi:uncharacterized membrane protein